MNTISVDLQALVPWLALAVAVGNFGFMIFVFRSGRNETRIGEVEGKVNALGETKASKDHVAVLAAKVDVVEDKITRIETDLEHMPDRETTHRLELSIGDLKTEMRGLSEKVKPIGAIAERIQEAIIEKVTR